MRIIMRILFVFVITLLWPGNSGSQDSSCEDRSNILAPGHSGWQINDCNPCHPQPITVHEDNLAVSDCVPCHGGNGAPVLADTHTGWKDNNCTTATCHDSPKDHNENLTASECSSCHGGNGAPVLEDTHTGWKDNNCTTATCHAQPITGHEDNLAVPRCASCHGGNGACARPWVSWHPKNGCSTYNCHGKNHGYTNNLDCGKCHFASEGVFQCTIYQ